MEYKTLNKIYTIIRSSPFLFKNTMFMLRAMKGRYLIVRLDTTNFCNLKCKMCFFSIEKVEKAERMEIETFKKVADKLFSQTRMLYLSCGAEPLVNRDFDKFIARSSSYGVPFISFATNGMLMKENIVRSCIENKISEIVFSIDGSTPETLENIRKGAQFEKVVGNLTMTNNMILDARSEYPMIRINFTLMKSNFHELEAFINHFSLLEKVYIIDIRPMRVHEGMDMEDEVLSENYQKEYTSLLKRLDKIGKNGGVILQYPELCYIQEQHVTDNVFCPIPFFSIYVDHKGEVRHCPYMKAGFPINDFNIPSIREIEELLTQNKPNCNICECRVS